MHIANPIYDMEMEDDYFQELEDRERLIAKQAKIIEEKDKALEEKDKIIEGLKKQQTSST
jgi:hypothetical protein